MNIFMNRKYLIVLTSCILLVIVFVVVNSKLVDTEDEAANTQVEAVEVEPIEQIVSPVVSTDISVMQSTGLSVGGRSQIYLGQSRSEIEEKLGAGVEDENIFYVYTDYDGLLVSYMDDKAALLTVNNIPTEVKDFEIDIIHQGASLQGIIQTYGEPFFQGKRYIEYYLYEKDGFIHFIPNEDSLKALLTTGEIPKANIYLLSIYADFDHPDTIYKVIFQNFLFVEGYL